MTINPPPICTTGKEIPKNARTWVPIKYDPTSKKKLFIAIRRESPLRLDVEYFLVNDRKMGLPPSGFTIGMIAVTKRKMFFAVSITTFSA
jgi:hypothetical protein